MATSSDAETAIRDYLLFLSDPNQLVDQAALAQLDAAVAAATDPISRLKALAAYERAHHPDEAPYKAAFIQHVKDWAEQHAIPGSAFEQMGVPADTLVATGLKPPDPRAKKSAAQRRVTVDDLKAAVGEFIGQFTYADLSAAAGGGSPTTIRKAVNELLAEGHIRRLGPTPNWTDAGRAPILYEHT